MKKIISRFILLVLILTPALNVNAEYSEKISLGINACYAGGYEELLIRLA